MPALVTATNKRRRCHRDSATPCMPKHAVTTATAVSTLHQTLIEIGRQWSPSAITDSFEKLLVRNQLVDAAIILASMDMEKRVAVLTPQFLAMMLTNSNHQWLAMVSRLCKPAFSANPLLFQFGYRDSRVSERSWYTLLTAWHQDPRRPRSFSVVTDLIDNSGSSTDMDILRANKLIILITVYWSPQFWADLRQTVLDWPARYAVFMHNVLQPCLGRDNASYAAFIIKYHQRLAIYHMLALDASSGQTAAATQQLWHAQSRPRQVIEVARANPWSSAAFQNLTALDFVQNTEVRFVAECAIGPGPMRDWVHQYCRWLVATRALFIERGHTHVLAAAAAVHGDTESQLRLLGRIIGWHLVMGTRLSGMVLGDTFLWHMRWPHLFTGGGGGQRPCRQCAHNWHLDMSVLARTMQVAVPMTTAAAAAEEDKVTSILRRADGSTQKFSCPGASFNWLCDRLELLLLTLTRNGDDAQIVRCTEILFLLQHGLVEYESVLGDAVTSRWTESIDADGTVVTCGSGERVCASDWRAYAAWLFLVHNWWPQQHLYLAIHHGLFEVLHPSAATAVSGLREICTDVSAPIDVNEWRQFTDLVGGGDLPERCFNVYWEVVAGLSMQRQRQLFTFITNMQHLPIAGFKFFQRQRMSIVFTAAAGVERLPEARTCSFQLILPPLFDYERLRCKLICAIDQPQTEYRFK